MSKIGNGGLDQIGPVWHGRRSSFHLNHTRNPKTQRSIKRRAIASAYCRKPKVTLPKLNLPDLEAE